MLDCIHFQENYNKANYVQISLDSYTHMTGFEVQVNTLEGQVKILEDQIKDLNKNLSKVYSEITAKESLVEQHAKIVEEVVSGILCFPPAIKERENCGRRNECGDFYITKNVFYI